MIVYILFRETNSGHSEASDGYIEAVYATAALAVEAKLAAWQQAIADGERVWMKPAAAAEENGDPLWTHDWRVEAYAVTAANGAPETPTIVDPDDWDAPTCLRWLADHTSAPNHYAARADDWAGEVARFATSEDVHPVEWEGRATAEFRQAIRNHKETP